VGVDRRLLAIIYSAYNEEEIDGEICTILKFVPRVAHIKAAIFPLVKSNHEIVAMAQKYIKYFDKTGMFSMTRVELLRESIKGWMKLVFHIA
jgi:glycyl-tRNA synthetase (class II)